MVQERKAVNWRKIKYKTWLHIDNFCARLGFLLPSANRRYMLNHLLKYPRNLDCFCGSGFKFKTCCLHKISKTVPLDQGLQLHQYIHYVETQTKGT